MPRRLKPILAELEARLTPTNTPPVLLQDIWPGNYGSYPDQFTESGGIVYFAADTPSGAGLWRTNGTPAGTQLIRNFFNSEPDRPSYLTDVNGTLFFSVSDAEGEELWKSDGTAAGTVLVRDIRPGPNGSFPFDLINVNGTLFFFANDGNSGYELWKSDGTSAGTVIVNDIFPGAASSSVSYVSPVNIGNVLYFVARDAVNNPPPPFSPGPVVDDNPSFNQFSNFELWRSDGTSAGTVIVRDIFPGVYGSEPASLTEMNGELYFSADGGPAGTELWKSDGTSAGTILLTDINPLSFSGSNPSNLTNFNGKLVFAATNFSAGTEPWISDGTAAGTQILNDISFAANNSNPSQFAVVGSSLFFQANSFGIGSELWKTDGTSLGTVLVRDIAPGDSNSRPSEIVNVGGIAYFRADDGVNGEELWRSDGTAAGTTFIDIEATTSATPRELAAVGNTLYFSAQRSDVGREPFTLLEDNTPPAISLVDSLNPDGSYYTGQSVNLTVTFTEPVTLTGGNLLLTLDTGAVISIAPFTGTTASATYLVGPGERSFDLDVLSFTLTNGATLRDAVGLDADLTLPQMGLALTRQILINQPNTPPTITSIPNQLVNAGDTTASLPFVIGDTESPGGTLTVSFVATTNNPPLLGNITIVGSGTDRAITVETLPGVAGVSTITVTVTDQDGTSTSTSFDVAQNLPPFISDIVDQTVVAGDPVGPLSFTVGAGLTPADQLVVTAVSDNGSVIPTNAISIGGGGADRTITITTQAGVAADTVITVTVFDPMFNASVSDTFHVIQALNTSPTISPIPNQLVNAGATVGPLAFIVDDAETSSAGLTVTVSSVSNPPGLLGPITLSGSGSERSIQVVTNPGVAGVSTIAVTVTDGNGASTDSVFTVSQNLPPFISDIPDQNVIAGAAVGPISFTIGAGLTPPDQLILSASTSNGVVIPTSAITFGGSGANRTVTISTLAGITAGTTVFVTVSDPNFVSAQATDSFVVNQTVNTPPTIGAIPDQTVNLGSGPVGPITLNVNDAETPFGLILSATSGNTALIPDANITFSGGSFYAMTLTPVAGQTGSSLITVTVTDPQGLTDTTTFTLTVNAPPPGAGQTFAAGRGAGEQGILKIYNADLTERASLLPFGEGFTCGIRVATADFTGDGIDDFVVGSGVHPVTKLAVIDGATLQVIFRINPFGEGFRGGAHVAAGDIDGDGFAEFAVAAGRGGGARVRVFRAIPAVGRPGSEPSTQDILGFEQMADFFALIGSNGVADTAFRGGGRAAIGDFNNDGFGDLVFAAGDDGGSRIAIFNGKSLGPNGGPKLTGDFFAYESGLRNGSYIAAADFNNDGLADLVTVPGLGGGPRVKVFDGLSILEGQAKTLTDFFVGDPNGRGGGHVGARDLDGDGTPDLLVGGGPGDSNTVSIFDGQTFAPGESFDPFTSLTIPLGVFVG